MIKNFSEVLQKYQKKGLLKENELKRLLVEEELAEQHENEYQAQKAEEASRLSREDLLEVI